jgi:hypothetical protein
MAVVSIGSVVVSAVPMGVDYGFSPVTIVPEGFQFPAGMESATPLGDDCAGAAGLKSVYPPPEPLYATSLRMCSASTSLISVW